MAFSFLHHYMDLILGSYISNEKYLFSKNNFVDALY